MSKKLLFFISFVLVLVLAGNVSAIEWVTTDLTGPPADTLWSTISNWDQTRLPDVTDSTTYIGWRSLIDANHICLIDGTVTAECGGTLYLGKQAGDPGYWASLDITGGSLTTGTNPVYGGTFNVAYWGGEAGDVNMTDGTINVGGGSNLQVGNGDGYFDLKGGTVYVGDPNGGGGRLNCRYPGILNVAGGTVVLDSNDPTLIDHKTLIEDMYFDGTIRAFNTRGTINVIVNVVDTNHSQTTLTATEKLDMAWGPEPDVNEVEVGREKDLEWEPGNVAVFGYTVYCSNDFNDVRDRVVGAKFSPVPSDSNTVDVGTMTIDQTYYWRVDTTDTSFVSHPGENIWKFTVDDGVATNPDPTDGDPNTANPPMTWDSGVGVVTHDLYLSNVWEDVNGRNPDVLVVLGSNDYIPGGLMLDTTYYWRVDEQNDDLTTSPGPIWDFTTYDYFILEDFEDYDNKAEILVNWHRSDETETKLVVYHEDVTVHGGAVAVKLAVANVFAPYYEYIYRDDPPTDMTFKGSAAYLSLWWAGDATSQQEKVYVKIEDDVNSFVLSYPNNVSPDVNAIQDANWHEWNIPLTAFSDGNNVDMANVQKFTLGVGDETTPTPSAGQSIVFFDDIEIRPPECFILIYGQPPGDITNDCIVNWDDMEIMATDWLMGDSTVVQIPPVNEPNLVAYYGINEPFMLRTGEYDWKYPNAIDLSGNGHDGKITHAGTTPIMPGRMSTHTYVNNQVKTYHGGALNYNPTGGMTYIDCGSSSDSALLWNDPNWGDITHAITVSAWVRPVYHQGDWPNLGMVVDKGKENTGFSLMRHWRSWNMAFRIGVPGCPWNGFSSNPNPYSGAGDEDGIMLTGPVNVFDGGWHHVAGTFEVFDSNNSRISMYVDGMLDASADLWGDTIALNDYDVWIGSSSVLTGSTGIQWFGQIDDARIYNRALPGGEIYALVKSAPNLVAEYLFEGNANDTSGHGHHGTLAGDTIPTFVADPGGNGKPASTVLDVGDANGYVNCGGGIGGGDPNWADFYLYLDERDMPLGESLSITAWVCPNSLSDWRGYSAVVSKGGEESGFQNRAWCLQKDRANTTFGSYVGNEGPNQPIWYGLAGSGKANLWDDQWHHVAMTYNGSEHKLYIDGLLDAEADVSNRGRLQHGPYDVLIGASPAEVEDGDPFRYWRGLIDDVRIYQFALSSFEVVQDMVGDQNYIPLTSPAELFEQEAPNSKIVNFRDYTEIAENWLTDTLWP